MTDMTGSGKERSFVHRMLDSDIFHSFKSSPITMLAAFVVVVMTLAALFIAQATGIELSLGEQLALLAVAMISSKGAAGVTGAGFITLAATLSIVPSVPVAGMALILGIDRFMSECRALTNFIGNAVATIVVARWEGALDKVQLDAALAGKPGPIGAQIQPAIVIHPPAGLRSGERDQD